MLKLFYAVGSCALASHITLAESGAKYELVKLDFSNDQQRKPEYLAINPKGRVPALVTDAGVLTETPAVLAFIAQSFPAAQLAPLSNPFEFARVQAFNSYLCSTVHVNHAHSRRGSRWADDPEAIKAMQRKVPETVGACFELMEREMFAGPWVMGDAFTICDPYLYTVSQWIGAYGVDLARFPKIHDHSNRMAARPAVKKALAEEGVAAPSTK
jgi:glutathione S-transferase